jgi:hypothetical protein
LNAYLHAQQLFYSADVEKMISLEKAQGYEKVMFKENVLTQDYDQVYLRANWQIDPT